MIQRLFLCFAAAGLLTAAQLPTAELVLNRYVEATGGAAAYEKVKTQRARGSLEFKSMGLKASIQTFAALPNNGATVMDLAGLGQIRSGVKDGLAWELSPMQGARVLEGQEREMALRMTRIDAPIRWRELYKSVTVEAVEEVDGRPCYKLVAEPVAGGKPETSWYDTESGLLLKSVVTLSSPMGEMPLETRMDEYRDVGGFRVPTKLTQKAGPQQIETIMDEVEWNVELPASQFDLPPDIEALVKKKKQAQQ
ncbi:MAG: hypothetical protein KJZ84_11070 [Bryobacteraceae bacterium]|nr:hypothetical protein [Bryobacteraceae bacterium]